jgi:hypothetical protein
MHLQRARSRTPHAVWEDAGPRVFVSGTSSGDSAVLLRVRNLGKTALDVSVPHHNDGMRRTIPAVTDEARDLAAGSQISCHVQECSCRT